LTVPPYTSRREAVSRSVEDAFVPLGTVRTIQSKFLDRVKASAEEKYLELLVDLRRPNAGYGYIQKRDGFTNLYVFRFEFNSTYASFYLSSDSHGRLEERRTVELGEGEGREMDAVLAAIQNGIDDAAKRVLPSLGALERTDPGRTQSPTVDAPGLGPNGEEVSWATIRNADPTGRKAASRVWTQGQDEASHRVQREPIRGTAPWRRKSVIVIVAAVVILVLLFVPIMATQSAPPSCVSSTCAANPTHYVSVTGHYLGLGGVYLPPGEGWTQHSFLGSEEMGDGTVVSGFGVSYYYFGW
jgi:hypothetical protein